MPETRLATVVYTGALVNGKNLDHSFREVSDGHLVGDMIILSKKARKALSGSPGCLYEVPIEDEKMFKLGESKFRGRWPDTEQNAIWEAESKAQEMRYYADKDAQEEQKYSDLKESLATAREVYRNSFGSNRTRVLAIILSFITG